jgi:hypothetical protein
MITPKSRPAFFVRLSGLQYCFLKWKCSRPDKLQYCIIILFVQPVFFVRPTVLRYFFVCLSGLQYCFLKWKCSRPDKLQYCVIIPFVQPVFFVRPTVLRYNTVCPWYGFSRTNHIFFTLPSEKYKSEKR